MCATLQQLPTKTTLPVHVYKQCEQRHMHATQYNCLPRYYSPTATPMPAPCTTPQCCAHSMLFRSIPSCTISHRGLISRSLLTWDTVSATAWSTSSGVVKRPRP